MTTALKRILVADDSATITTLLTVALTNEGFDVTTAEDGLTTYELGKTGDYDLVIIDQLMPGLLGLEVIGQWRDDEVKTPVIMLSGVDDDNIAVDSLEKGAVDYVRKPFRLPELLARVHQHLTYPKGRHHRR